MKKTQLNAKIRTVTGRKVKQLRKDGLLPITIYGKGIKSITAQVQEEDFAQVYETSGETGVVELTVDKKVHPVLIHTVQIHPVTSQVLHVEFLQVDLTKKITTSVPLVFVGESQAVKDNKGVLIELEDTVDVEALPTDLPEHIEVDISALSEVGDEVLVQALHTGTKITIVTAPETPVVRISELAKEPESEETTDQEGDAVSEEASDEKPAGEAEQPEGGEETPKEE